MTPRAYSRKKYSLLAGLFLLTFQFASAQFNQQWLHTWDDSLHQDNRLIRSVIDNSGNIFLTGVTYDTVFSVVDIRIVKYDMNGNLQWVEKYVPSYPSFNLYAEPAIDTANNIYIAVDVYDVVNDYYYLEVLKYAPSGNLIWNQSFSWHATSASFSVSRRVFLDSADNIFIGSAIDYFDAGSNLGGLELTIVKPNSTGNYITEMRTGNMFSHPHYDLYSNYCRDIEITQSQKIYSITNIQQDSTRNAQDNTTDFAIQKHDTSGARIFITQIFRSAMNDDPNALFIGSNEDIFVTGATRDSTVGALKSKYLTTRLDSSGNILYVVEKGDTSWHSTGKFIVADNLGNAYVAGYTTQFGTGDIELVKYDPNGNEVWSVAYNSPFNNYDEPNEMTFTPDGNLLISASSYNGSNYDILLLKYDTAGTLLDSLRYNSAHNLDDVGYAIYSNTGQLYLAGSSQHPTNSMDYLAIKFGTTTSVNELSFVDEGFSVYPNPAHQTAVVQLHSPVKSRTTLILSDIMGREVVRSEISKQKSEIDVSNFESGIYFIRISSEHNTVTEKLIVKHK